MRSSPKFLVVSRSELPGASDSDDSWYESSGWKNSREGRDDPTEFPGIKVNLQVSYKTLLLIFLLFGVLQRIVNLLVNVHSFHLW
jgi:hypothetical protein